jgi:two-component system, OmpR family, response regulator ResD
MFARTKEAGRHRPLVIVAHSDPEYAAGVTRAFRRYGWVVETAADGPEARRLASSPTACLVVLEADLPEESGWLTCAKLNAAGTRSVVVLVSGEGAGDEAFAEFAGAARLVTREQGCEPLLEEAGLTAPVSQVV